MDLTAKTIAAIAALVGAGLLLYGVALIYPPAAVILAGLLLLAAGLLPDWGT